MRDYTIYKKIDHIIATRNEYLRTRNKTFEQFRFIGMFNYCTNLMKEEYLFILKNSYFNVTYRFWWLDYYCQSSYYRKRFTAVSSFVSLFEMIYENFTDNPVYLDFVTKQNF